MYSSYQTSEMHNVFPDEKSILIYPVITRKIKSNKNMVFMKKLIFIAMVISTNMGPTNCDIVTYN